MQHRKCYMKRGSVMMEFLLVLPLLLLLFGATFLTFDVGMGKLHLQEANRNLAWLHNDRYNTSGMIEGALYHEVKSFYEVRNALESNMVSSVEEKGFWDFGTGADWGRIVKSFKDNNVNLKANDNSWANIYTGNMELKMTKVSGVYIGAIGISSVLFSDESSNQLYQASYDLTRSDRDKPNFEAILVKRKKNDDDIRHKDYGEAGITDKAKILNIEVLEPWIGSETSLSPFRMNVLF